MWLLTLLPTALILWFTNLVLLVGVVLTIAGFFAHRIPIVWKYQLPFKILGAILLCAGVYFRGGYAVEVIWRERVAELEKNLEEAKAQGEKVNTVIKDRVVYKDRIVNQQAETLIQYVDREIVKTIPAQCDTLPVDIIQVHNRAARLNEVAQELENKQK